MDSEKTQRSQKKEKVGANLEAEFVPMETTKKKANKNVVVMEDSMCLCTRPKEESSGSLGGEL